jgi:multicomponent Na+:H+ antiporter subunit D
MTWLPPLLVAVPLLAGALIGGMDHVAPRAVQTVIATAASLASLAFSVLLLLDAERGEVVHWFGGWHPRGGVAIGIDFAVDPLAAGMCVLVWIVVLGAVVYSIAYMPETAKLYDALLLIAGAAMCGFAMSGDLFNLFVWLELMGVAGYALTGFEVRQLGPLQGALNFAIVNTIGGFLLVIGIAFLYARTGALNLAQIGTTLAGEPVTALVVVAMTLTFVGFLCKAAVVPFHAWLADAYAVAPAPVCLVLAGAMTDIGLVGVARLWFLVFSAPLAAEQRFVGDVLLALGLVSALLGGAMALLQRHLKRMLAYSVICHVGVMLAGIALLSSKGVAGAALMLVAHGLTTGGLFLVVGVLLAWLATADELELHGRARRRRWIAAVWFAGAIALVGPPYVGVYLGHALIDDAAVAAGRAWVEPLLWLSGALAGAALLRAGLRIFVGVGPKTAPLLSQKIDERPPKRGSNVPLLGGIAAAVVALGVVTSLVPGLGQRAELGAERFRDRAGYVGRVLRDAPELPRARPPLSLEAPSGASVAYGLGATALALLLAASALRPRAARRRTAFVQAASVPVALLRAIHSGVIGDYVVYIAVGTAVLGGVWMLALR